MHAYAQALYKHIKWNMLNTRRYLVLLEYHLAVLHPMVALLVGNTLHAGGENIYKEATRANLKLTYWV